MAKPIYLLNIPQQGYQLNSAIRMLAYNPSAIDLLDPYINIFGKAEWSFLSRQPYAIHFLERHQDKIIWNELSSNPAALHLLRQNMEKINWNIISGNSGAIPLLEENINKINWKFASLNINAIHLLENNLDKDVDWKYISSNINAIPIIEKNMDKVNFDWLSPNINAVHLFDKYILELNIYTLIKNPNPNVIPILEKHLTTLLQIKRWNAITVWRYISRYPNAMPIIEKNINNVHWQALMSNTNKKAIELLQKNLDKIQFYGSSELCKNPSAMSIIEQRLDTLTDVDWMILSSNPEAIPILKKNLDKVCWFSVCRNPNAIPLITKLDYKLMRINNQSFCQELVAFVCHPNWLQKCATRLGLDFEEYQELLSECNVL
jgi:hypothetical protein